MGVIVLGVLAAYAVAVKSAKKEVDVHSDAKMKEQVMDTKRRHIVSNTYVKFTADTFEKVRNYRIDKKNSNFITYRTSGDGNCGFFAVIQGLIESYCVMGKNRSHIHLKKFMKSIQHHKPIQSAIQNKHNNYIQFARPFVNALRLTLHDYFQDKAAQEKTIDYSNEINALIGGITEDERTLIDSQFWMTETILTACANYFDVPFLVYVPPNQYVNYNLIMPIGCDIENCQKHIVFMKTNGGHFEYMSHRLQNYDKHINLALDAMK